MHLCLTLLMLMHIISGVFTHFVVWSNPRLTYSGSSLVIEATHMLNRWLKEIPENLIESFRDSSPPLIFVGSGFGKEALPPIKTGAELAEDIRQEFNIPNSGEELAELLQYLQNKFSGSKRKVIAWLKQRLLHNVSRPGGAFRLLLDLPCKEYLTTNFDSLLLDAAREVNYRFLVVDDPGSYVPNVRDAFSQERTGVLGRLHGAFENEEKIVAMTDDYITNYTSGNKWRELLQTFFREKTVVFIGYSMKDFTTWTSYISMFVEWRRNMLPHILVAPVESSHIKTFWSNYGIQYVPLKAHQFLIAVHDKLGNLETREDLVIAAAAACLGKGYNETEKEIDEKHSRSPYPTKTLTAKKMIMESQE